MADQFVWGESGEITVADEPLALRFHTHAGFLASRPTADAYCLRSHLLARAAGYLLLAYAWPLIVFGTLLVVLLLSELVLKQDVQDVFSGLWIIPSTLGVGLLMRGFALLFIRPWCRFDRRAGEVVIRHVLRRRRIPLAKVVALQVIPDWLGGEQLNLVLDDAAAPRVFVLFVRRTDRLAERAQALAEFLGVPLLVMLDTPHGSG